MLPHPAVKSPERTCGATGHSWVARVVPNGIYFDWAADSSPAAPCSLSSPNDGDVSHPMVTACVAHPWHVAVS